MLPPDSRPSRLKIPPEYMGETLQPDTILGKFILDLRTQINDIMLAGSRKERRGVRRLQNVAQIATDLAIDLSGQEQRLDFLGEEERRNLRRSFLRSADSVDLYGPDDQWAAVTLLLMQLQFRSTMWPRIAKGALDNLKEEAERTGTTLETLANESDVPYEQLQEFDAGRRKRINATYLERLHNSLK